MTEQEETPINFNSPLKNLIAEKKNLRGYISWGKRQMKRHIKTGKPIITQNKEGDITPFSYFYLEKELREAILELFDINNIIIIKRKIKKNEKEKN